MRKVTVAARYFPMSFAEDTSSSPLTSSLIVDLQDTRHNNDNDDDTTISNSQQASADQAPAIATHRSRWNRVGRNVDNGGEGKGRRVVSFGKGIGGSATGLESEVDSRA